jgi:transcriptional regulator with XRE-family HTH domain
MDGLLTDDPEVAAKELDDAASDLINELDRLIPRALHGQEGAVRAYVRAWRGLSSRCLRLAHDTLPDLVLETNEGELLLVDVKRATAPITKPLLDYLAVNAPFSSWVTRFGPGRGAAVFLLAELREAIPSLSPLPVEAEDAGLAHWTIDRDDFSRFARQVWLELQEDRPVLERIQSGFGLSLTELARLFGVRRQAVSQWLDDGMPAARQPKALVVAQIADLLERNLLPARIPPVARTPADPYGGRSMLEMIAADRHEELLERVRGSFDWAATA